MDQKINRAVLFWYGPFLCAGMGRINTPAGHKILEGKQDIKQLRAVTGLLDIGQLAAPAI